MLKRITRIIGKMLRKLPMPKKLTLRQTPEALLLLHLLLLLYTILPEMARKIIKSEDGTNVNLCYVDKKESEIG